MDTLDHILQKFDLNPVQRQMPIPIPNFGRNQLAEMLTELGFQTGVEVGVAAGEYLEILCKANPNMVFYGIDPWEPQQGYRDYVYQKTFNRLYNEAVKRLSPYDNYSLIKSTSQDALEEFEDGELDFVYIDADHSFSQVANDVHMWLRKLKPGGIIAGHDYFKPKNHARIHVVEALQGYTSAWDISPWFVLGNQATDEGLIRDKPRSWLWVK